MVDKMNSKSPEIRFNGFTDDWEQRKLDKLAEFAKGSGYSKSDLKSEGTPVIHYGRLYTNYETSIKEVDTFVEAKENSIISKGNEVIVPASGETSEDISRASVVVKPGVVLGGDLNIIKPGTLINPTFLALTISNGDQQKELTKRAQGKSVVHIRNSDLKEVNLSYPKIDEQSKIGIFFEQLENTIALHQRELDNLIKSKKGFLQKMFPKKDEKTPEIRFNEFTGDWQEHKLGELSPLRGGFAFKSSEFSDNGVPIVRISNILSSGIVGGDYAYYNVQDKDDNYLLPDRAAVLAMSGATTGKVSILENPYNRKVYQNQRVGYFVKTINADYEFISTLVRSKLFTDQLASVLVAGAQPNVSSKDIDGFKFMVPSDIQEQHKIGKFFKQIDDTIVLHQHQLDKLKQTKKAFLQKMFV